MPESKLYDLRSRIVGCPNRKFTQASPESGVGDLPPNRISSRICPNQGLNLLPELASPNQPELNSSGQNTAIQMIACF